jgi:hypothetical protein
MFKLLNRWKNRNRFILVQFSEDTYGGRKGFLEKNFRFLDIRDRTPYDWAIATKYCKGTKEEAIDRANAVKPKGRVYLYGKPV